jgi:hypothetical protein
MKLFNLSGILFFAAIAGVLQCSRSGMLAGNSSSETTNGIMAAIHNQDGSPAAGATVRLRRSDYVTQPPGSSAKSTIYGADALTDAEGRFQITGIDKGDYSIEVRGLPSDTGRGCAVLLSCSLDAQDTVNFGSDTLRPYAAVHGSMDTSGISGKPLFVQVPGLERLVPVNSSGGFMLNDLPAGLFNLRIVAVTGSQTTVIRTDQVSAVSGDTVFTMPGWGFAKRLFLNTTASGAGVAGNVLNFPVLVRLTGGNFNFSQAKLQGQDLRFAKSDGSPLPYEIERWDASAQAAEIWVKADTVRGNDNTHYIVMYCGNSTAAGVSNSAAVFDTASGFAGVWHLTNCNDATGNRHDGANYGAADAAGMIGAAKAFDGTDSIRVPGLLGSPSSVTLSAWVNLGTPRTTGAEVVSLGNAVLVRMDDSGQTAGTMGAFNYDSSTLHIIVKSGRYLANSGWHHIAFSVDTILRLQSLYIDGTPAAIENLQHSILYANQGTNTLIGTHGNGQSMYSFIGSIDEVRVCDLARSADWIKLCYMNQKANDALVEFR